MERNKAIKTDAIQENVVGIVKKMTNEYRRTLIDEISPYVSAYLYMFGGWLTSREEKSGPFSSSDNAVQMADLLDEFIKKYELADPDFNIVPDKN